MAQHPIFGALNIHDQNVVQHSIECLLLGFEVGILGPRWEQTSTHFGRS